MPCSSREILSMLLARRENYTITKVLPNKGRSYTVVMGEQVYTAVLLSSSFQFYEKRYHLARQVPTLIVCFEHDTVVPVAVLSMRLGNFAQPYELPEGITDVSAQRLTQRGSQCLLGMYLSGVRLGQTIVNDLPTTTRKRYLSRAKALSRRARGKPVGETPRQQRSLTP